MPKRSYEIISHKSLQYRPITITNVLLVLLLLEHYHKSGITIIYHYDHNQPLQVVVDKL